MLVTGMPFSPSITDSRDTIRKIVPLVSSLLQPLARNDPEKLHQLVLVRLQSMLREMSAFQDRDEPALEELRLQIAALQRNESGTFSAVPSQPSQSLQA